MGSEDHKEELSRFRQRRIDESEKKATVHKTSEEEITFPEMRYRRLIEAAPDGILIVDAETGLINDVNPFFLKLSGYSLRELLGKKLQKIGPFKKTREINELFSDHERKECIRYDDLPLETKDGQVIDVEVIINLYMLNHERVMQCNVRETSGLKKVEDALRESERRYRDIAENAREWIWEVDAAGKYSFSSNVVEKILGYRADEILGKYFYDLFHPEDREELKRVALEAFATKQPFREFLNRNLHKSGRTVWLSTSGIPLLDDSGNLLGYRGVDADITEMIITAESLRESEELFRSVAQSALDAIIVTDDTGNIRLWNDAAESLFGYSTDETVGKQLTMIIPERFRTAHAKGLQKYVSSGKTKVMGRQYEIMVRNKEGREFPAEISVSSWTSRGNIFFTGIVRDITVRKQLEEKMHALCNTDELTGLLNRRGFLTLAQKHIEIARRNKRNFSLLYLDLNDMKKINDAFGHRAGDQALIDIADVLRRTFRASDIIARIGGDEFTVLITETRFSAIENIIDHHIQDNLRMHNEHAEEGCTLSVSMGMVHYNSDQPCTLEELLARADELMYEHKQGLKETMPTSIGVKREERGYERYKAENGPSSELVVSGGAIIKNISLGGMSLRTAQRLTKNTIYNVRIPCRNNEEMASKGCVVWTSLGGVSEKDDAEPYYEAGLRFIELNESLRSSLEKYLIDIAK